jgi:hypothetical protein
VFGSVGVRIVGLGTGLLFDDTFTANGTTPSRPTGRHLHGQRDDTFTANGTTPSRPTD